VFAMGSDEMTGVSPPRNAKRSRRLARAAACLGLAFLTSCSAGIASSGASTPSPTAKPQPPSPSSSLLIPACAQNALPHQAADLEALLPNRVAGRELEVWSARGQCWLDALGATPEKLAKAGYSLEGFNVDDLAIATAGRSDTQNDPPYFVFVLLVPKDESEQKLAIALFSSAVGITTSIDPATLDQQTVGGKDVLVGTTSQMIQSEHQRGLPYLYETPRHFYIVVTDDPAWAADALRQLPPN